MSISAKAVPPALLRGVDRRADILVAGDSVDGTAGGGGGIARGNHYGVDITGDKQVRDCKSRLNTKANLALITRWETMLWSPHQVRG